MRPNLTGQSPNPNKPENRRGQILFINADAEFYAGRAQNYLKPEHVEKIVSTYDRFENVPSYARRVPLAEISNAANDWNLNIRRYVDNSPPAEAHGRGPRLRMRPICESKLNEWRQVRLGDVARIRRGASPRPIDSPRWFAEKGPGWVRISDVTRANGRLCTTEQYLSQDGVDRSVRVGHGDVIMSICATIGEPVIVRMDACIHDGFVVFDNFEGALDRQFLLHLLRKIAPEFKASGQTGTQANLNTGIVNARVVTIPRDIREQSRIAAMLDTIDEAIAKTEGVIVKLKQMRAGLLHDLLTRGLDEHGQLRDPIAHPEQFKDSSLGRIPKEWRVRRLCEVAAFQTGKAFPSDDYRETGIRLLRPGNLPPSEFVTWEPNNTTALLESWVHTASEYLIGGGELVMNLTAQSLEDQFLGRVCMTLPGEQCLLNQRLATFRPLDCHLPFLFWSLRGSFFRLQIDRNPQGTKIQHIYNRDLEAVVLPIPERRLEQELIASVLFSAAKQIVSEELLLAQMRQLKSGLMNDLLTGRVRVPENILDGVELR